MQNRIKLVEILTSAVNKKFFNSFFPIIPTLVITGIIAQLISASTESVMIFNAVLKEFENTSLWLSIPISTVAMILIVAVLELGGRKFVQVLSRLIVWKKEKNKWFWIMFFIVTIITSAIIYLSFWLSTSTIQNTFTDTHIETVVNDSLLLIELNKTKANAATKAITATKTIEETFIRTETATKNKHDALINEAKAEQSKFETKKANGEKWAASHVEKYKIKVVELNSEKTAALETLTTSHAANIEQIQAAQEQKETAADSTYNEKFTKLESAHTTNSNKEKRKANLYGNLFMYLTGFCVILAYGCIGTVEVFRRGSGIETEFKEEDARPYLLPIIWETIDDKIYNFFHDKVMEFSNKQQNKSTSLSSKKIGFNLSNTTAISSDNDNIIMATNTQEKPIISDNRHHGIIKHGDNNNNNDNTIKKIEGFKTIKSKKDSTLSPELLELKEKYRKARLSRNTYNNLLKKKEGKSQDHNRNKIAHFENIMSDLKEKIKSL